MSSVSLALLLLGLTQAGPPAHAERAAPACQGRDIGLAPEFAGWTVTGTGTGLDRSFQMIARDGAAQASFTVPAAGRYRIALDQPGWIDVASDGRTLDSVGHGHGPECSTIRKLVAFDLAAGTHQLRVTRLPGSKARAMIVSPAAR